MDLNQKVSKACEIYHKIYKHPEFDKIASRNENQREQKITQCITALQKTEGITDLTVLDIGCAEGFLVLKQKSLVAVSRL